MRLQTTRTPLRRCAGSRPTGNGTDHTAGDRRSYLDLVGTIRSRRPEETLKRIRPHFRALGIVRIARVTGLDCIGIPVSTCIRPGSKNLSVSQGKGFTPELADVSAAMESIELFHAENPRPPDLRATWADLSRDREAVHPSRFVPGYFPEQIGESMVIDWVRAEDLPSGRPVYLPHALIDFDQTQRGIGGMRFFISTNGLASGNTLEEATCHGLYEVIERDSTARWFNLTAEEKQETAVDTRSIDGPCRSLIERFEAAGVRVLVWDATASTGVPTFISYIRGVSEVRGLATFGGMGTHLSRDIALSRALTESAQSRLTIITGSRDDKFPGAYAYQQITAADELPPRADEVGMSFQDCMQPPLGTSFAHDLDDLLARVRREGFSHVLRVDHTRAEFEIPVVHIFVPGMQVPPH